MSSDLRQQPYGSGGSHIQDAAVAQSIDLPTTAGSRIPGKARVVVVEDHDFVREEIVALLNRQSDLICCGQADSIDSTVAVVAEQAPDVVLLDLRLKNADAFDLISSLRYQFPRLVILVLSQCDEVLAVRKALRAGAQGYVTKHEATDELLVGLRAVLGGELYVSRALALRLLRSWLVDRRVDQ